MHEVVTAHDAYRRSLHEASQHHQWGRLADAYTLDAVFRRNGLPDACGREAIRLVLLDTTGTLPGSLVDRVDVVWYSVDTARGRVVQEIRHQTCDPGDGSVHTASATSTLAYGGEGLWARCDVVHAPTAFVAMYRSWARAAERCGRVEVAERVLASLEEARPTT